jgi:hypothetical protein
MRIAMLHRPSRRLVFILAVVVAIIAGIPALAAAVGPGSHPRDTGAQAAVTGQSTGGDCRIGFDTQTNVLTPPDDSTSDNVPAGTVNLTKQCQGAVVAVFSSEVNASAAGEFIHLDMRATCTGTGGFTNPCTVGQIVFGQPGHTFFQNAAVSGIQVHSMTMVFPGLRRGLWRFEVLPGGNGTAFVDFRTFTVQAFAGG